MGRDVKGYLVLLIAGLSVTALTLVPALLPPKTVVDERLRLDPVQPNYGDGTGGGGFAIGLPGMDAGDLVRVEWELQRNYDVRILPAGDDERPPRVTDVAPLETRNDTADGSLNFTAASAGSYWLTFTVPEGGKLEKGTVRLHWDPPLERARNPIYVDMGLTVLAITLLASGTLAYATWQRDRKRGGRHPQR